MRIWLTFILLTLFALTACAPSNETPTPTIVRLDRSALVPTSTPEAVEVPPTATRLPFPSPTPTPTPFPASFLVTPAPSPIAEAPATQVEVIAVGLNLRQGPGVNYPTIGAASAGDLFEVTGADASGAWLQVTTAGGQSGWLSGKPAYTRLLGSLADVPMVEAASPASTSVAQPAGVSASPAGAAGGGPDSSRGRLVFMTGSGGELYVINADGTELRHLVSGVIDPVVSPDLRQVAFTRWDGAKFGALYVLNLDGSGERAIVGDMRQPKSPTWSPDGQEIIISFQHGGRRDMPHICRTFDADDGINLPDIGEITKVHVGVNGVTICFIPRQDLQWRLRQINVATGKFKDQPSDPYSYNPAWDPQNPWLVLYDGEKGLVQLDVTNGESWPVTTDLRDTGPVFSPDGQQLALTYKQHDHWEVYTLDLETGARQRLTKPPILADPQYNSAAPAWSPDGSQLAFVTDRTGKWEIWVMNVDGSEQRPLFSPEVQAQLGLEYRGVNERMLNWIP